MTRPMVAAADLDQYRWVGDELADGAVAGYFREFRAANPGELFGGLVRHTKLPPEEMNPALRRFFAEGSAVPDWVDAEAVRRGQRFFNRLVAHHFSALYLASLPSSYAAAKGVQVLRMTGRLQTDTQRRLNETAQLLMAVAGPGTLDPGGSGIDRILHVRLMHAAVRWMIESDPSVLRVKHISPPQTETAQLLWSTSWGVPVNQEDLAGTWLTFTSVVYDAFDASGVDCTDDDIADHMHMWRLVAHYLGLDPHLVPLTRTEADDLRRRIFGRQQVPCAAGRAMTEALVAQAHHHLPKVIWPLLPTAFRHFLGDRVANIVDLPPTNWSRAIFPVMTAMSRIMTAGADRHRLRAKFDAFVGRRLMDGILREMRHGTRPAFSIPTHLAETAAR